MIKAYLAGSIFYEKDIMYNAYLAQGIRKAFPGIAMYVPQEATINDKTTFADSTMIYNGDYERLKNTDLLIACVCGDLPPIGTVTEIGIFSELAKQNPEKRMVILHTDTRDACKTISQEKIEDMAQHQCASQFNYFNLFTRGVIETCGVIVETSQQLFEYVQQLYYDYIKTHHPSGIYLITNRLSGKKYIGQSKDICSRLNQHRFVKTVNPQVIDLAIQKYGIENFTFEILEECPQDQLEQREIYWCDEKFAGATYAPKGYNIARAGGQYGLAPHKVSSYDLEGNKIQTYLSIKSAASSLNITDHSIAQSLEKNYLCLGMMWAEGEEEKIDPYCPNPRGKMVDMYDQEGKLLKTFENMTRAAEYMGTDVCAISASCLNGQCIYGYSFRLVGEEFNPASFYNNKKVIYQYDKNTHKFINSYNTSKLAHKETGLDSSGISKTCKGYNYYYGGYIWSYIKWDEAPADYKEKNVKYWATIKNAKELEREKDE